MLLGDSVIEYDSEDSRVVYVNVLLLGLSTASILSEYCGIQATGRTRLYRVILVCNVYLSSCHRLSLS